MDSNAVVLEISSDEEGGWNGHDAKGTIDGCDDHNWIAELLDEVNRDDCVYNNDGADDSDEVVVVSEVLPKRPRKKLTSKSSLICLDDDCVVLEHDPDKPLEVQSVNPINRDEDDDSDDLLVVSEKGQVACRDYPHPRHLCIKFPFSSTPIQSHCDQCYCYVCDSLAPCMYWGNGGGCLDHCHATDKDDFWKLERQNSKNSGKVADAPLSNQLLPTDLVPPTFQNQVPRSNPTNNCPLSSNFGAPNIIKQNQTSPVLLPRNKFQPSLVLQQLIRTSRCTVPREIVHHYSLASPFHKPVFKRTVSAGAVPATYQYSDSSHRDSYRNFKYSGSSPVNTSVPFSPQTLTFEEPVSRSNTQFDFPLNFQPLVNSDSYVETPVLLPPLPVHPLVSQPQRQSSLPNYSIPSGASQQESQSQRQSSTVDPKTFPDISWPRSQTNQQPATQRSLVEVEGVSPVSEPSLATGSGGLVDYEYDNWMFNNQPCEPSSMDVPGLFGFNELPSQPAYMDAGTIFDF